MSGEVFAALIGAVVGAILGACLPAIVSIWIRNADKWKLFQEDVGVIKSRLLAIEGAGIEPLVAARRACLNDLTVAVWRIRPYIFCPRRRGRLAAVLEDFRTAEQCDESGFKGKSPAGPLYTDVGIGADCVPDPVRAKSYLISLLDKMAGF